MPKIPSAHFAPNVAKFLILATGPWKSTPFLKLNQKLIQNPKNLTKKKLDPQIRMGPTFGTYNSSLTGKQLMGRNHE